MRYLLVCLLFFAKTDGARADGEADQFFQNGNAAFQQGNFAEAARNYEAALAAGQCSAALFANLGHAFFRQKMFGKAILHYERARLLAPDDARIREDIALARRRAGLEESAPVAPFLLQKWWQNLRDSDAPDTWAWAAVALAWLSGAGVWFGWRGDSALKRRLGWWGALVFSGHFLLALPLALSSAGHAANAREGVVVAKETPVFTAPDARAEPLETLREGEKVGLPDGLSGWWKVALPSGEEGWVTRADVEAI